MFAEPKMVETKTVFTVVQQLILEYLNRDNSREMTSYRSDISHTSYKVLGPAQHRVPYIINFNSRNTSLSELSYF